MTRLATVFLLLVSFNCFAEKSLTIGIFSYRPKAVLKSRWQPLTQYLEQYLDNTKIHLKVLDIEELDTSIRRNELDFVLTNPRHYIFLRQRFPLSVALATLIAKQNNTQASMLGGVFITRSDRTDINQLLDLKNKSIASCGSKYLGGFQAQVYELAQHGLDFNEDINLSFTGAPHDNVIHTVLQGDVDAGFVRTGAIEQMQQEGKLDIKQLKIINKQDLPGYPFQVSTRLYPEWPFVGLSNVDSHIANKIASALLALDDQHPVSISIGISGFTVPANYLPVEEVMRELRLAPFDTLPTITLEDIWQQHKSVLIPLFISLVIVVILVMVLIRNNRKLTQANLTIRQTEKTQKDLFNYSPAVIYMMDLQGHYLFINRHTESLFNRSNEDIKGKTDYDIFPKKYADKLRKNDKKVLEKGSAIELEETAWLDDGEHIYLSTKFPLKDASGKIYATCGISTDITERKLAEQQIAKFKNIIDNSLNEVYFFDSETLYFVYANQGAQNNMGYSIEEFKKLTPLDIKPRTSKSEFTELIDPLLTHAKNKLEFTSVHQRKDGTLYPVEVHLQLTKDSPALFVAFIIDISARIQAEEQLKSSELLNQQIIKTVPDLMWLKDTSGKYMMCNPQFEKLVGKSITDILGKTDYDLFEKKSADFFQQHDKEAILAEHPTLNEETLTFMNDGHKGIFETIKSPLKTDQNKTIGILGIARDITERKQAEEQSHLAASVFDNTREGVIISNTDNIIIDANPACCSITGYTKQELLGHNPKILSSHMNSTQVYEQMWQSLADSGHWSGDIWNRHKSGKVYAERLSISKVYDQRGGLTHYVGVFSDITYIKEHEAELEQIAQNDALTGLPNRLLLRDRMSQALAQTNRHDKLIAICYLDLDGFKPVNDTHGHKSGDLVLIEVANRLLQVIRNGDTAARLGGDEFVLLLIDIDSQQELDSILNRIIHSVALPVKLADSSISVSASIGVTLYPNDNNEADILLRHADQAMYEAKQIGKNCFTYFDPRHEAKQSIIQNLHREIEIAIKEDQFQLDYQPKINMRTGETIGFEALIRWQHPIKGLLSPVAFLPMIENHPLIINLGDWVLKAGISQLDLWSEQKRTFQISINIAALQLQQIDFIDKLKLLLSNHPQVSPAQIELEILETAALDDLQQVNKILNECYQLGINIALDDFGTGYSSLTYLKSLSVQTIKIDQSFIRDILIDQNDLAIVEGILQLAKSFDRKALAEGVETYEHASLLLMLGCDLAQGYAISRPLPAEQIPDWVDTYKVPSEWKLNKNIHLENEQINLCELAVEHNRFIATIINAIDHRSPTLLPNDCHDPAKCKLGNWLSGSGKEQFGNSIEFKQMTDEHTKVHKLSGELKQLINEKKSNEIQAIKINLMEHRNRILSYLRTIQSLVK